MDSFENFNVSYSKPFKICFDLLGRSNLNIFDSYHSLFKKHFCSCLIIACIIVYHISLMIYMSNIFTGSLEILELPFIVPVLMVATQGILKATILVSKKAIVKSAITQLGYMWRTNISQGQISKRNELLTRLNIFHSVFYWMNILGSWQYMLTPLLETVTRRFILQQDSELLFPFKCSFPFDPRKNWYRYIVIYLFQCYSMLKIIYVYLGAEFLMITLCAHLTTEFVILQDDLKNVNPTLNSIVSYDSTEAAPKVGIKAIVRRHQMIINLSGQINDIFNHMIFLNLLFATITICFFGFIAKVARGPADLLNNLIGVVASMLPIFNLCYYGEQLKEASETIALSVYEHPWYKGDVKYQKIVYFIMKRSQIPCCLTSLKYAPITLNTFTAVLSTTWSYFSLATSLYEED